MPKKRKCSTIFSDDSEQNGSSSALNNNTAAVFHSSKRSRASSSILLAEYLKEGETPSCSPSMAMVAETTPNNNPANHEIISLNSDHAVAAYEPKAKKPAVSDNSHVTPEEGSSSDMIGATGNNSLLKDRILTLTQMLKQVKQEEEQLLKKIHSTAAVTPRARSNGSSRVLRQPQRQPRPSQPMRTQSASSKREPGPHSSRRPPTNESTLLHVEDEPSSSFLNIDNVPKTRPKKASVQQSKRASQHETPAFARSHANGSARSTLAAVPGKTPTAAAAG